MSTYLVAFVVSNFDYRGTKTSNNVAFRIWARKDAVHQVGKFLWYLYLVYVYFFSFFVNIVLFVV